MAFEPQERTVFSDPKQRFKWAFRNVEVHGFPIAFPEPTVEELSEHLSRCGFIHVSEVEDHVDLGSLGIQGQVIHYQPPIRGQDHGLNTSGTWVPVTQPLRRAVVPAASLMTPAEKAKMIQEFKEEGLID